MKRPDTVMRRTTYVYRLVVTIPLGVDPATIPRTHDYFTRTGAEARAERLRREHGCEVVVLRSQPVVW